MASFGNLKLKNCACCSKRLGNVPKRGIRRVNINDSLDILNTVKPIVLTKKKKVYDQVQIKIGDLLCGTCRSYAKNYKKK